MGGISRFQLKLTLLGICNSQPIHSSDPKKPDITVLLKETLYGITFEITRGDICEERADNGAIG